MVGGTVQKGRQKRSALCTTGSEKNSSLSEESSTREKKSKKARPIIICIVRSIHTKHQQQKAKKIRKS
jgi:hypothetical protein